MQKITPCFWFDGNAEEAMKFYLSVFKNGKTVSVDDKVLGSTAPGAAATFKVSAGTHKVLIVK